MEKMKAVVIPGVKEIEIREIDKPVPGPGQVLVRNMACALCTVEQRAYLGVKNFGFPLIGGHENAGYIVAVGEGVTTLKVGDHVVADRGCGKCYYCRRGMHGQCESRGSRLNPVADDTYRTIGAGLAQYILYEETGVLKINENVPYTKACLNEPLADVVHSVNRAQIEMGDTVVVIGAGFMGQLHAQIARMQGARVIVAEVDEKRRKLAEELGAHLTYNPLEVDAVEFVKNATEGRGADVVFNTTAISSVWEQALKLIRKRGKVLAYSSQHPDNPVGVQMGVLHSNEYEIVGTINSSAHENYVASRLIEYGIVNVEAVTAAVIPFSKAKEAFETATVPNTFRVIVDLSEE